MTPQQCASLARAEAQKVQEDLGWILAGLRVVLSAGLKMLPGDVS